MSVPASSSALRGRGALLEPRVATFPFQPRQYMAGEAGA
jgi:hypothetical protein